MWREKISIERNCLSATVTCKTGEDGEGEKSNILLLQVEKQRNGEE